MPEYSVRLVLRVAADSPEAAAPTFITHLVENGMTDWAYQVCDPNDDMKVIGYFDGFGLPVDIAELEPASDDEPDEPDKPAPVETPQEQTPVQTETPETDAELLALAEELNAEDAAPEPPAPAPAADPAPEPQPQE